MDYLIYIRLYISALKQILVLESVNSKKTIPFLFSILAIVSMAAMGVLGNTQIAYAGGPPLTSCTISPDTISVQIEPNGFVDIEKTITCDVPIAPFLFGTVSLSSNDCLLNDIGDPQNEQLSPAGTVVTFTERITNLGDISEEHCTVGWTVFGQDGPGIEVTQTIWINEPKVDVIGGSLLPIDNAALLLAGLQTNIIWMLPVLAGAAGAGFAAFKLRRI